MSEPEFSRMALNCLKLLQFVWVEVVSFAILGMVVVVAHCDTATTAVACLIEVFNLTVIFAPT